MHSVLRQICQSRSFISHITNRSLSTSEVATALRPFYFAVHPDLFCQHPHEKEVNETSLKTLKAFLDTSRDEEQRSLKVAKRLTFYVRKTGSLHENHDGASFQKMTFDLVPHDLKATIKAILTKSKLPTDYIDGLRIKKKSKDSTFAASANHKQRKNKDYDYDEIRFAEDHIKTYRRSRAADPDLRSWLFMNMSRSYEFLLKSNPIRNEISRLNYEIIKNLDLVAIKWNCNYGLSHKRGCIQSFHNLIDQHPLLMKTLKGKTVAFGSQSGISMNGNVMLNHEDVRQKWLDIVRSAYSCAENLSDIPQLEKYLSELLGNIKIIHSAFRSVVTVQSYRSRLRKLIGIIEEEIKENKDLNFFHKLDDFELSIENESGPLMLSPSGLFISPSSCPAYLLVGFINDNLEKAKGCLQSQKSIKNQEEEIIEACVRRFGLASLEKDENITSDKMITCCERLLLHLLEAPINLNGYRLKISNYYFVNQDGNMFIPWNWKTV